MAAPITVEDVRDGFETDASDSEITLLIGIVSGADACLDANNVPEDTQKALKVYAVRHLLTLQANSGQGTIRSQTAPNGASRSFFQQSGEYGQTPYSALLKQLDAYGCVTSIIENDAADTLFMVVGGSKGNC